MPAVAGLRPNIKDNSDGTISIEYHPTEKGRHEVQMSYDGVSIEGGYSMSVASLFQYRCFNSRQSKLRWSFIYYRSSHGA